MRNQTVWTARRIALPALLFVCVTGCDPAATPPVVDGNGAPQQNGNANAETGPIVRFVTPASSTVVRDDEIGTVSYSVDSASNATVGLFLDPDNDPANGNERDFAQGLLYGAGVTQATVDLNAGFYPYGAYFVKARASDGNRTNVFSAPGLVNIVEGGGVFGSDDGGDVVPGLQLIYDSGKPQPVGNRVPFIDTWHVVDVLDNLAPRMVVPIEFDQPMQLHRLQFYVFGIDEPRDKRVEIYQGTNSETVGTLLHSTDLVEHESRRNGWWNTVTFDPPLSLEAGQYGFSYHAAFEFTEHWAGNAPLGAGYVWASPVQTADFQKVTHADFGYSPNFGIRVVGVVDGSKNTNARVRMPDRRAEAAAIEQARNSGVSFDDDLGVYEYGQDSDLRGLHTVWRSASQIYR